MLQNKAQKMFSALISIRKRGIEIPTGGSNAYSLLVFLNPYYSKVQSSETFLTISEVTTSLFENEKEIEPENYKIKWQDVEKKYGCTPTVKIQRTVKPSRTWE